MNTRDYTPTNLVCILKSFNFIKSFVLVVIIITSRGLASLPPAAHDCCILASGIHKVADMYVLNKSQLNTASTLMKAWPATASLLKQAAEIALYPCS